MTKPFFPLFVDITEKKIIVVGGGKIAQRRVETLLLFAENIRVIAPEITEELARLNREGKLVWTKESYGASEEGDARIEALIKEADMLLAATDDGECNEKIAALCRRRNVPVNTAHKKELCDFYFPAVVVKENVAVGITASGLAHAEARQVRERVEEALSYNPYIVS